MLEALKPTMAKPERHLAGRFSAPSAAGGLAVAFALVLIAGPAQGASAPFGPPPARTRLAELLREDRGFLQTVELVRSRRSVRVFAVDARTFSSRRPSALARVWSSDNRGLRAGLLGPNWRLCFETRLRKVGDQDRDRVLVEGADLERFRAINGERGVWRSIADGRRCLKATPLGYTLTGVGGEERIYDKDGRLLEVRGDGPGRLRVRRDEEGRPTALVDGAGRTLTLTIKQGRLRSVQDPLGRMTRYHYDALGRLARVELHAKAAAASEPVYTTSYGYSRAGLETVTEAAGVTRLYREKSGRMVGFAGPGRSESVGAPPKGKSEAKAPARPEGSRPAAELELITAAGRTLLRSDGERLAARDDEVSLLMTDRRLTMTRHDGGTLSMERDALGRVTELRQGEDRLRWIYDGRGRLERVLRGDEAVLALKRSAAGSPEGESAGDGAGPKSGVAETLEIAVQGLAPWQAALDGAGALLTLSREDATMTVTRDAAGRITGLRGLRGRLTFGYDALDRLVTMKDGRGGSVSLGYDAAGRPSRLDRNGQVWRYEWTPEGELAAVIDALGRRMVAGETRLTREIETDSIKARDAAGRPTAIVNEAARLALSYDAAGRVTTTRDELAGWTTTASADAGGRRRFERPTRTETITRDGSGRPTSHAIEGLGTLRFKHGADGVEIHWPNGLVTTTGADKAGVLTSSVKAGESLRFGEALRRDAAGRVVEERRLGEGGFARRYVYDAVGRLERIVSEAGETRFELDENDNIAAVTGPGGERRAELDGPSLVAFDGRRFERDAAGRRTRETGPDGRREYVWTGDRLSAVRLGETTVRYGHDALGRRAWRELQEGETKTRVRFVWDADRIIAEVSEQGEVLAEYIWGDGPDELLAAKFGDQVCFVHRDLRGSVRMLTDAAGAVVARYDYDAYGRETRCEGPLAARNPYRFAGLRRDPTTGLLDARARWYDPATMRFLSRDPAGYLGGLNAFAWCRNDPINHTDPTGMLPHALIGAAVGAVLGAGTSIGLALLNGEKIDWKDTLAMTVSGAAIGGLFAGTGGMAFFAKSGLARAGLWTFGGGMATGLEELLSNLLHKRPWHHHLVGSTLLGAGTGLAFFGAGQLLGPASRLLRKIIPKRPAGNPNGRLAVLGRSLASKAKTAAALMVDNVVLVIKQVFQGGSRAGHAARAGAAELAEVAETGVARAATDAVRSGADEVASPGMSEAVRRAAGGSD